MDRHLPADPTDRHLPADPTEDTLIAEPEKKFSIFFRRAGKSRATAATACCCARMLQTRGRDAEFSRRAVSNSAGGTHIMYVCIVGQKCSQLAAKKNKGEDGRPHQRAFGQERIHPWIRWENSRGLEAHTTVRGGCRICLAHPC